MKEACLIIDSNTAALMHQFYDNNKKDTYVEQLRAAVNKERDYYRGGHQHQLR